MHRVATAFEGMGPARALIHAFREGGRPYLAKDIAAFMVQQCMLLDFPFPDLLIPVPSSFVHATVRGYAPSILLAKEMGLLMKRPVKRLVAKQSGYFQQTKLTGEQRAELPADLFVSRGRFSIEHLTVLLVDDLIGSYATLRRVSWLVHEGRAQRIFGIGASFDLI